jgi:hypothetical protein
VKYIAITYDLLLDLLRNGKDGKFYKVEGLPDDAMVLAFSEHYLFRSSQIAMKVWSSTFPIVPEATNVEELELWISLVEPEVSKPKYQGCEFI